jgi:hypothetical protein
MTGLSWGNSTSNSIHLLRLNIQSMHSSVMRIGLYELETGQRLPLVNEAQDFVELPDFIILEVVK